MLMSPQNNFPHAVQRVADLIAASGHHRPLDVSDDGRRILGKLPSPCISACAMNAKTGLCDGCMRTMDEILAWGGASEETKLGVWLEIARRQDALW